MLDPETIETYELVYEKYFGHRYRLTASGYYYRVDDLISSRDRGRRSVLRQSRRSARERARTGSRGQFDSGVLLCASYALQKAVDDVTSDLSSSPRHMAKLILRTRYRERSPAWSCNTTVRAHPARRIVPTIS